MPLLSKNLASALFAFSMVTGGAVTLDAHSSSSSSSSCSSSSSYKSVNVGYPGGKSPVPLTRDCLLPQIIEGTTTTIYSGTAVEPTVAVNPANRKHIVAAWQQGRVFNGGALEIGIAYSDDYGQCWKQTTVPLQICDGGITQRLSDPWLSYSKDGKVVYLNALAINATQVPYTYKQNNAIVSTSHDNGKTWSKPSYLYSSEEYLNEPTGQFPIPDKCSITADPNNKNNAYSVYNVFPQAISFHADSWFNKSTDKGKTWQQGYIIYDPSADPALLSNGIYNDAQTINNVVVVLPESSDNSSSSSEGGDLLDFMVRLYAKPNATDEEYTNDSFPYPFTKFDIAVIRSQDQGDTWTPSATLVTSFKDAFVFTGGYTYDNHGRVTGGVGTQLRTGDIIPAYTVNPSNGNLYVAYQTGEFTPSQLPQIGLVASYDSGYTWTDSARVSRTPLDSTNPQAFTPFVAATKDGYVGVLYFDFRNDTGENPNKTFTDAWLAIYQEVGTPSGGSTGIGLDFVREVRLSSRSYVAQNGPDTTQGVMTDGDYCFLVAEGSKFYALYTTSQNGPFKPAKVIYNDPLTGTELLLDSNYRTAPYFRAVKP